MMLSDRSVKTLKSVTITVVLLIGIFVLSYVSEVDSQPTCPFQCIISDDDYIFDEIDLSGSDAEVSHDFLSREKRIDEQAHAEDDASFIIQESLFYTNIDMADNLLNFYEGGDVCISFSHSLHTNLGVVYGMLLLNRCKSQ